MRTLCLLSAQRMGHPVSHQAELGASPRGFGSLRALSLASPPSLSFLPVPELCRLFRHLRFATAQQGWPKDRSTWSLEWG